MSLLSDVDDLGDGKQRGGRIVLNSGNKGHIDNVSIIDS